MTRKKVNASQFKQALSGIFVADGLELDEDVTLNFGNTITIRNCLIKGELTISGVPNAQISFEKCSLNKLRITGTFDRIQIQDTDALRIFFVDERVQVNSFAITNFLDIKTISEFIPSTRTIISMLRVHRLNSDTFIVRGNLSGFQISQSRVSKLYIQPEKMDHAIVEEDVESDEVQFGLEKIQKTISKVRVEKLRCKQLSFYSLQVDRCELLGIDTDELSLSFDTLKSFEINVSNQTEEAFPIRPRVGKLVVNSWPTIRETNFLFANIKKLNEFNAMDVNYFNEAFFDNFKIREKFLLMNSSLIKCKFNKIDLQTAQLSLWDTYLQDSDFVNVEWPDDFRINEAVDHPNDFESLREAYRQLKRISLNQNNKIHALEFQRNEMRMQYEILSRKPKWGLKNFKNLGNFLIVGTHKWVSDFGQNIWKPLLLLLGFHLIWFHFLMYTELGIVWSSTPNYTDSIEAVHSYFNTLLPTHGIEQQLASGEKIKITGLLDFVMRIFSGYFIFYFIYVSRKYHQ